MHVLQAGEPREDLMFSTERKRTKGPDYLVMLLQGRNGPPFLVLAPSRVR